MPRTRKNVRKSNYQESSDSDDDHHDNSGMLMGLLGFFMDMQRRSAKKNTPKRKNSRQANKKRQSTSGCDCLYCSEPKRRCTKSKSQPREKATAHKAPVPKAATATTSVNLDSDDEEIPDINITKTHVDNIKNKVDNFFKALDSDEEEQESKLNTSKSPLPSQVPEKKDKDFYTLLSDSEDEKEKPSTSANNTNSFSEPSTSGTFSSAISNGLKMLSSNSNKPERKPEDLFAYVDDILNDCSMVDLTSDKPKENVLVSVDSLEDLKKKTDEILGTVTSLIDDLKPKPKEPEKKAELEEEAPSCPICLEPFGRSEQTMATLCGHMFCKPCIEKVAATTKKCPTCRKGVTKTKYHPVYL